MKNLKKFLTELKNHMKNELEKEKKHLKLH